MAGELTSLFHEAGFQAVHETGYLRAMFRTLRFLRGAAWDTIVAALSVSSRRYDRSTSSGYPM